MVATGDPHTDGVGGQIAGIIRQQVLAQDLLEVWIVPLSQVEGRHSLDASHDHLPPHGGPLVSLAPADSSASDRAGQAAP